MNLLIGIIMLLGGYVWALFPEKINHKLSGFIVCFMGMFLIIIHYLEEIITKLK